MKLSRFDSDQQPQKGAVLPLLALLAVLIFLFVAFAIDLSRVGSAHQKQGRTAELTSLTAMEAYLQHNPATGVPADDYVLKLEVAKRRAEEVAGSLDNVLQGSGANTTQVDATWELAESTNSLTGPAAALSDDPARDNVGEITPGRWWFDMQVGSCPPAAERNDNCPCDASDNPTAPCFQPNRAGIDFDATAFRVRLRSHTGNPVRAVFGRVAAKRDFSIENEGTATLVPRRAVFAVDFSNSIAGETHNAPTRRTQFNSAAPPLSQAAYKTTDNSCTDDTQITPDFARFNWRGRDDSGTPFTNQGLQPDRSIPGPPPYPAINQHYQTDYACVTIDRKANAPDAAILENYLVDRNNIGPASLPVCENTSPCPTLADTISYRGPEPLSSILNGIRAGLLEMNTLSVPGDQVLLLGFDDGRMAARTIGFGPAKIGFTDFDLMLQITNVDPADAAWAANLTQRINRVFFPVDPGFTDIPEVLVFAMDQISKLPASGQSNAIIAIFTDGLGTCSHFNGGPQPFVPAGSMQFLTGTAPNFNFVNPTKACSDKTDGPPPPTPITLASYEAWLAEIDDRHNRKSMAEVSTIAGGSPLDLPSDFKTLADSRISVHTFLFGDYVQPHTFVRKGPLDGLGSPTGCMSDRHARASGFDFTDDNGFSGETVNDFNNIGPNTPILRANRDLHGGLSSLTQGTFNPIRVPCDESQFTDGNTGATMTNAACADGELIKQYLDPACNALGAEGEILDRDDPTVNLAPAALDALIDHGRLICDPYCRSKEDQVIEQVRNLFGQNPFILVEKP